MKQLNAKCMCACKSGFLDPCRQKVLAMYRPSVQVYGTHISPNFSDPPLHSACPLWMAPSIISVPIVFQFQERGFVILQSPDAKMERSLHPDGSKHKKQLSSASICDFL
jgi:hypothetical protein